MDSIRKRPLSLAPVFNVDANVDAELTANQASYYEALLLLPGNHRISVPAQGFNTLVRGGIGLPVNACLQVDMSLIVGAASESRTVTAEAPMLDTSLASSSRVIDEHSLQSLPMLSNIAFQLPKFSGCGTWRHHGLRLLSLLHFDPGER